jgi:hypothetical protein
MYRAAQPPVFESAQEGPVHLTRAGMSVRHSCSRSFPDHVVFHRPGSRGRVCTRGENLRPHCRCIGIPFVLRRLSAGARVSDTVRSRFCVCMCVRVWFCVRTCVRGKTFLVHTIATILGRCRRCGRKIPSFFASAGRLAFDADQAPVLMPLPPRNVPAGEHSGRL